LLLSGFAIINYNQLFKWSNAMRKKVKQELDILQVVLDAIPDFVALKNRELQYTKVNKAFCRFVFMEEKDIIGKTDSDIFPKDVAEENRRETLRVLENGETLEREFRTESPEGYSVWRMAEIPLSGPDGNITGVFWSGRDITQLKELESKIVQFQKMEGMGPLAAGIAHELNTPLGIIIGYAQLLKEDVSEDSPIYEGLEVIENQSKVCRKIVGDLLRFSRQTESQLSELDLNQCIEEVVSVVEHIFHSDRIRIKRDYGQDLPLIKGDKDKLKQVFLNLLSNAHDAIGTDGDISISTKFDMENDEVNASFVDTGIGIPPDIMDRIFDPFFTTKAVDKGTGLGLSVTFGIVQEHEGRLEVQSPPWLATSEDGMDVKGTAFIVKLPASKGKVH
jgi:two-component system NtrC family sensor kinase